MKNQRFLGILIGLAVLQAALLTDLSQATEPYAGVYCDPEYGTECTKVGMGKAIYLEIVSPVYNLSDTAIDTVPFRVVSGIDPTGITGVAAETGNDTATFQAAIIISYDESRPGTDVRSTEIYCDRMGDAITIRIDLDNDGTEDTAIAIDVLYDPAANLSKDAWTIDLWSFLPMMLVGVIMALVPKKVYTAIMRKLSFLKKIPKIGDALDFEAGEGYLELAKKSDLSNPLP